MNKLLQIIKKNDESEINNFKKGTIGYLLSKSHLKKSRIKELEAVVEMIDTFDCSQPTILTSAKEWCNEKQMHSLKAHLKVAQLGFVIGCQQTLVYLKRELKNTLKVLKKK